MNMITKSLAAGTPVDAVRALPRSVTGFHVVIETDMELEDMRASLEGLAERSAFDLAALDECARGTAEEGRELCAEFTLAATNGTVGDPQIFALLRDIAGRHRWNAMQKRLTHAPRGTRI
ncbi:hypothetical protein [Acuticoccus sp. I52.16.1]|uniref:hypothetical protein n=1 Tax=Acuticoccus sp. I52.16.1 TaxID=2928472 RepID=UPI001FD4DC5C|nr:hypothetical protein [Acuticoccus sp. I52.16.1]UOM36184.1 hypothetical protein MRB58_08350 [Acuticoccus sp. I52.16.1]